jgi:hypothetical protein
MLTRATFVLIAGFWVTMNILLWRAEFGSRNDRASAVPASLVWEKILTAPDSSSLSVVRDGKKIGFGHWITSVGEEWAKIDDENIPTGQLSKIRGYRLRFEGSAVVAELTNRLRFELSLKLGPKREWEEFNARVSSRPQAWEIRSSALEQTLQLKVQDDETRFERIFTFSELQNPAALAREFIGPFAVPVLNGLGLPMDSQKSGGFSLGVNWTAAEDMMRIGRTQVRVYRLQTRLLDRYPVKVLVSRVGEILRVELPGDVTLVNDQLTIL